MGYFLINSRLSSLLEARLAMEELRTPAWLCPTSALCPSHHHQGDDKVGSGDSQGLAHHKESTNVGYFNSVFKLTQRIFERSSPILVVMETTGKQNPRSDTHPTVTGIRRANHQVCLQNVWLWLFPLNQWFSMEGNFAFQGSLAAPRHFWLSRLRERGLVLLTLEGRGQRCC